MPVFVKLGDCGIGTRSLPATDAGVFVLLCLAFVIKEAEPAFRALLETDGYASDPAHFPAG